MRSIVFAAIVAAASATEVESQWGAHPSSAPAWGHHHETDCNHCHSDPLEDIKADIAELQTTLASTVDDVNNHTTQLATIDGQVTQLNSWVQNIFTQSAQSNQDAAQALATANAFSDAIYQI